jgi:peptidoglycan/LPS O-acetylase OafA/YrhL
VVATVEAPQGRRPALRSLTGIRGVAAGVVFVNHIAPWIAGTPLRRPWYDITYVAICGVILFFVLSGFLLAQPNSLRGGPRGFWRRRAARILPVYVLSLAVAWSFGMYYNSANPRLRPANVLANLFLVQSWGRTGTAASINLPAWSLSVELLFYALLPLTLPRVRDAFTRSPAAALATLVALTQVAALAVRLDWVTTAFPPVYLPVFYLGVYAAVAPLPTPRPRTAGLLAAGAVAVSVPLKYFGLVAPAFVLLIASLAAADRSARPTVFSGEAWQRFGVWSYAFFLFHVPVGVVMLALLDVKPTSAAVGVALAAVQFVLSWIAAWIVYTWFEEPVRIWLLRVGKRSATDP